MTFDMSSLPEGGTGPERAKRDATLPCQPHSHEVTDRLVFDTAMLAGVNLTPHDIDVSHRIGAAKPGKDRTIIVRFTSFRARQELYNARKKLRSPCDVPNSSVSAKIAETVFLSDNLTRANQFLLYQARKLKKADKISAAWSDVGRLKIRVTENGPTKIITSLDDLQRFAGTLPEDRAADASASAPVAAGGGAAGRPRRRRRGGDAQ